MVYAICIVNLTNGSKAMTYSEIINHWAFKALEEIQSTMPNTDILSICGFMVGLPDAEERLLAHLASYK